MTATQTITINATPHPGQKAVHASPARFKVLSAGRRWGKTRLGVMECFDAAVQGGRAWWVAPTYKISEVGWRPIRNIGGRIGAEVRRADRQVILRNGGEIAVRSADNPDSLRGEGLDLAVLDECAFMSEDAWTEALRPALSDRQGRALFISTPKGRNWFWRMWMVGQQHEHDTESWQFPTATNPRIKPSEIDAARDTLPEQVFAQEYLAEFVEDAGTVFRRVMAAAVAIEQHSAQDNHDYLIGVDWGKHNDFTVLTVLDTTTRHIVYIDRFNQIDYMLQVGRLKAMAERFRPSSILAESNSMGEPLIEQLQREGLPVQPFQTNNASKTRAIDDLALAFERGEIGIPNDPILIGELQAYEQERLPSGLMRYGAPEGMHDDCVMSLAIAWQGVAGGTWYIS